MRLDIFAPLLRNVASLDIGPADRGLEVALVEVEQDEEGLGEAMPVDFEHRHLAGRIDREKGRAVLLVRRKIDRTAFVIDPFFGKRDQDRSRMAVVAMMERDHAATASATPSLSRMSAARWAKKPLPIAKAACSPGRAWQRRSQPHKRGVASALTSSG